MNRTAIVTLAGLALLGLFAALAVGVVHDRRPLSGKLTRSFGTAVSRAAGTRATVVAPTCSKVAVAFYTCDATVTPRRTGTFVNVSYNVWLDDDGCWDTQRRTHTRQSSALGRLRARFDSLRGCI